MRHGKKFNHLSRTASHRKALLSNMASSLILHKRINTTVAKAKELRKYVEPLLTRAKEDTTHSRRMVFSYLHNKDSVKVLFGEVAEKISARPGGYTRILKTGHRIGDNADMCIIELVDYNEAMLKESTTEKTRTRRSRRGGKSKSGGSKAEPQASKADDKEVKTPKTEEVRAKTEDKEEERPQPEEVKAKTEDKEEEKPQPEEIKAKAEDTSNEGEEPENESSEPKKDQ
jgi:large subunit ribosomal protein L17